MHNQSQTQIL